MKRKYHVTTTCTRVETWIVEAEFEEEAELNCEEGELLSEDTHGEVTEVQLGLEE